ncbi:hypothetical protein [Vibrio parahaemolyticus RIMD 2210633]|uniref:Uncharacterized protein n=1 Tax=Vibrio parahaemolyticus serotype O3:K6 (strain RIMD 2210633) TaxID=223926 RepID=Q87SI3_VIBPA|nr:hypothetical protein [Vibrio parahaemolyticus RIMD 2210633]
MLSVTVSLARLWNTMSLYVLLYVQLVTLLVTLVALNVRKLVYVKHVVVHSSLSVNFLLPEIMLSRIILGLCTKSSAICRAFCFLLSDKTSVLSGYLRTLPLNIHATFYEGFVAIFTLSLCYKSLNLRVSDFCHLLKTYSV